MLYLAIIGIFFAVALISALILYPILTKRTDIQQRIQGIIPQREQSPIQASLLRQKTPLQDFLTKAGQILPKSSAEHSKYTEYLVAAGYHKESLYIYLGCKFILAITLPLIFIILYSLPTGKVLNPEFLLVEAGLLITGFLLPSYWLQKKVHNRSTEIFHSLPDVLDLLTICVEAGVSIDASLVRVTENPQFNGTPLAEEIKKASMEMRAGKLRTEALKDMADRTRVDDVKAFVTMLIQTERFGTSLSQALRVHSDSLRTKRRQIAEEAAAKTSVKMLLPLVFFVFPALLIVILGPAFMILIQSFK